MQSETPETLQTVLSQENSPSPAPLPQHGIRNDLFESPSLSQLEEHGGGHETGSEWSLSTSSSPSEYDAWLNPIDAFLSESALFDDDFQLESSVQHDRESYLNKLKALRDNARLKSPIQQCPHGKYFLNKKGLDVYD